MLQISNIKPGSRLTLPYTKSNGISALPGYATAAYYLEFVDSQIYLKLTDITYQEKVLNRLKLNPLIYNLFFLFKNLQLLKYNEGEKFPRIT